MNTAQSFYLNLSSGKVASQQEWIADAISNGVTFEDYLDTGNFREAVEKDGEWTRKYKNLTMTVLMS